MKQEPTKSTSTCTLCPYRTLFGARTLRAGAVDGGQQAVVGAERTVEPQRVVERGHLHVRLVLADPVREGRGAEQLEVGRVGEQGAVQLRCVADLLGQAEPDPLDRKSVV